MSTYLSGECHLWVTSLIITYLNLYINQITVANVYKGHFRNFLQVITC